MKNLLTLAACAVIFANIHTLSAQVDHGHANAGASGGNLIIENYADYLNFEITLTYVPLDYLYPGTGTNLTRYKGYYQGNVTFTVLAATSANGGPEANAPALGSYIHLRLVSVDGPDGGSFGFWENAAVAPTFSMMADATGGTNMWRLSNNNGSADSDPFGHVHGRRFTVDTPGNYTVGFQLVDTSINGPGGGPIYGSPSQVYSFAFTAVPEPSSLMLTVGSLMGLLYFGRKRARTS